MPGESSARNRLFFSGAAACLDISQLIRRSVTELRKQASAGVPTRHAGVRSTALPDEAGIL